MEILITLLLDCVAVASVLIWVPSQDRESVLVITIPIALLILMGSAWSFTRRRMYPGRVRPAMLLLSGWMAPLGCALAIFFIPSLIFTVALTKRGGWQLMMLSAAALLLFLPAVLIERRFRSAPQMRGEGESDQPVPRTTPGNATVDSRADGEKTGGAVSGVVIGVSEVVIALAALVAIGLLGSPKGLGGIVADFAIVLGVFMAWFVLSEIGRRKRRR